ncbi:Oidioi.mRNA.OKI2018_I69.PAR.g13184.t1.cds [Oikopleura dioica]|uniref:Oidioi.mRNA.OKI2018_I69.PAR.g13184.t1.cds n=1 Tax=Oikopleura dioica TaxID=34765 RepID=A0ABN7S9N4_OIKDI|nr:Oidioi.mRNA.OKI2018_I69.PAR.g13184.t1.cds [Oikopleura dioica]
MTKSLFSQEEIHSNFENNYYDEYDFMQIKDIKMKGKHGKDASKKKLANPSRTMSIGSQLGKRNKSK